MLLASRLRLAVAPLIVALAGCNENSGIVSGRVTFEGKPLVGGSVIVYCDNHEMVRGLIQPDGTYVIPNVPVGNCRVTVKTHPPLPAGFQLKQNLPPVHEGPIPPDQPHELRKIVPAIPDRYGLPEESGLSLTVRASSVTFDIVLVR